MYTYIIYIYMCVTGVIPCTLNIIYSMGIRKDPKMEVR